MYGCLTYIHNFCFEKKQICQKQVVHKSLKYTGLLHERLHFILILQPRTLKIRIVTINIFIDGKLYSSSKKFSIMSYNFKVTVWKSFQFYSF